MADMLWVGYSGRWVHEKWGRDGAFSDEVLGKAIKNGHIFVILGNVQEYLGTELPGGSKFEGERFLEFAKEMNSGDMNGKLIELVRFGDIAEVRQGLATGDNKAYLFRTLAHVIPIVILHHISNTCSQTMNFWKLLRTKGPG